MDNPAEQLLSALGTQLIRRGYIVEPTDDGGLHVTNAAAARTLAVVVTCGPRADDGDQLWFFQRGRWDPSATPAPVAEADHAHFAEALVILVGVLSPGAAEASGMRPPAGDGALDRMLDAFMGAHTLMETTGGSMTDLMRAAFRAFPADEVTRMRDAAECMVAVADEVLECRA